MNRDVADEFHAIRGNVLWDQLPGGAPRENEEKDAAIARATDYLARFPIRASVPADHPAITRETCLLALEFISAAAPLKAEQARKSYKEDIAGALVEETSYFAPPAELYPDTLARLRAAGVLRGAGGGISIVEVVR